MTQWIDQEYFAECDPSSVGLGETVPDGTVMAPGQEFLKTWTLRNPDGDDICAWDDGYNVVWNGRENLSKEGAGSYDIADAEPGEEIVVEITMVAPQEPGTYRSDWILRNRRGDKFGDPFWAEIVVGTPSATPEANA